MFHPERAAIQDSETNVRLKIVTSLAVLALGRSPELAGQAMAAAPQHAVVTVLANHRLATFRPSRDWGAALDGHDVSETTVMYSPANIAAMKRAGFGPITYRLRTELGIETWHWNPEGQWSDPAHQQG